MFVIFRRVGDLAPTNVLCYEVKSKCCSAVAVKSAAHCTKVSVVLFCTNLSTTCVRLFEMLSLQIFYTLILEIIMDIFTTEHNQQKRVKQTPLQTAKWIVLYVFRIRLLKSVDFNLRIRLKNTPPSNIVYRNLCPTPILIVM